MTVYVRKGPPEPTKQTPRRPPAQCGTDGGYFRHRRITKTPPCLDCLDAHAEYERERLRNRAIRKLSDDW